MRSKLITVLMLGAALGAAPALADDHGHKRGHGHRHAGYYYPEPVRVVRYERYVEVPPPRVYYPAYSPRPVYVHYDEPRHRGDHDHDLIKWIGGAIVLGEIIHHTGGH
jgi:hypothetical protein